MSTASAHVRPHSNVNSFGLWLLNGLSNLRSALFQAPTRVDSPRKQQHQEAEKLRAMAREMMRIDPGYAADMFMAADRHEFGDLA